MQLTPRRKRDARLKCRVRLDTAYPNRADTAVEKVEMPLAKSGHVLTVPGRLRAPELPLGPCPRGRSVPTNRAVGI